MAIQADPKKEILVREPAEGRNFKVQKSNRDGSERRDLFGISGLESPSFGWDYSKGLRWLHFRHGSIKSSTIRSGRDFRGAIAGPSRGGDWENPGYHLSSSQSNKAWYGGGSDFGGHVYQQGRDGDAGADFWAVEVAQAGAQGAAGPGATADWDFPFALRADSQTLDRGVGLSGSVYDLRSQRC